MQWQQSLRQPMKSLYLAARALSSSSNSGDTLGRRLLSLVYPKRSAAVVLRRWEEEGNSVQKYYLNRIIRDLRKNSRFKHALEICEWMSIKEGFKLLPGDYAVQLDLIAKVRGLPSAEKFFDDLPSRVKEQESPCSALLHCFVLGGEFVKAESFFKEMCDHGLITSPVPYNHMILLSISKGEPGKVPEIVSELKKYVIPDLITYNLWLAAVGDRIEEFDKVFDEMRQRGVDPDWVTFSTLAKGYSSRGIQEKVNWALEEMEKRLCKKSRVGYSSLITHYASLSNKVAILRVWEKMKGTFRKASDREYACVISSLMKVSAEEEAEEVYDEWEIVSGGMDTKIVNQMFENLVKKGRVERGKVFLQRMLKKGIKLGYHSWCIMARGYMDKGETGKAMECVKKALALVKKWEPDEDMVKAMLERIEREGDVEKAEEFLSVLRRVGYVKTWVYNLVLRTYAKAEIMPLVVAERMEKDGVEMDDETRDLIRSTSRLCVGKVSALI